MSTPNVQRDPMEADGFPLETQPLVNPAQHTGVGDGSRTPTPPRWRFYWLDRAFYGIGAVAGIGFLVVLFGAYVTPNLVAILVGTIIIIIGVVAWIITALLMTAIMVKNLFGRGGGSP